LVAGCIGSGDRAGAGYGGGGAMIEKPQPIKGPVYVQRCDWDDGSISYELWDNEYHRICSISNQDNRSAKRDCEMLAKALNHLLGCVA
jgi:hypothetical protein